MSIRTNRAICSRAICLLAVSILLTAFLSACGVERVEIDVSVEGLNLVENVAPSEDYAFYVSSGSVPRSAEDLRQFGLMACTGEAVANRAIQVGMGLGISSISGGHSTTECIEEAIETRTLVLTQRTNRPPSGVTEIVFR